MARMSRLETQMSVSGTRFSKAQKIFRARKAIFSLAVPKHRELYTPETFCMKGTGVHLKIMRVKQLCNHNIWEFNIVAFRVRKLL